MAKTSAAPVNRLAPLLNGHAGVNSHASGDTRATSSHAGVVKPAAPSPPAPAPAPSEPVSA